MESADDAAVRVGLSPAARAVLTELGWAPTPLDRLAIGTAMGFGEVCQALDELMVAGLARELAGRYERIAPRR